MTAEQKRAALEALALGVNNGLVTDEECSKELAAIGATEEELERLM